MKTRLSVAALLVSSALTFAAEPPPTLRIPGVAGRSITPVSLLGAGRMDVIVEGVEGDVVYHGLPLLEVIEKSGLETRTMAAGRKVAPAIVVATARDGYTVAFSVGELLMHRSDPRVYLVAETAAGPLPENEGPVRLIVLGDRLRSAYALKSIELRYVAQNPGPEPAKPKK
ncbi:MAG: hypothetical protein ACRD1Z_20940 [Vicinamibacteria bacterium]